MIARFLACAVIAAAAAAADRPVKVNVNFAARQGPLEIDRIALGQGGLSELPMWQDRVVEIRNLHPRVIRLFLQEYFDVLPRKGRYHWDTLDESVDLIRRTGATPVMAIAFKPPALFPTIDEKIVEPSSYDEWDKLIYEMVRHYKQRGSGIRYWEVSNEPDIGENGGCPYLFTPESYVRYYRHTVNAILRADPGARVGGPALASHRSPILPALLAHCQSEKTPVHFVSWHIYNSSPQRIRETIDRTRALIRQYPELRVETFLDEWNMALREPPRNPQFQPCFVTETAYQMKEGGLDYSCYYHIRDFQVDPAGFARFMSPGGVALMARWWNRNTQWDGLFDYQNRVRPAYFAFKLLSRLTGLRAGVTTGDAAVHGLAASDDKLGVDNLLIWNFSETPAAVTLAVEGIAAGSTWRRIVLDASAPSDDENSRLRPLPAETVRGTNWKSEFVLEPYGVNLVWLERRS